MSTKKFTVTYGSLEDHPLPETIYKYRHWSDDYHKRFITEKEVFLASPATFEDDLDCNAPTRFDLLTEQQIYEYYYNHSKQDNPTFIRQQHRNFAREWKKKAPFKNKQFLQKWQDNHLKEYQKREGILSLTENWNNDTMWEKYSNDSKGFCIGYHGEFLFPHLGGGGAVDYVDIIPDILPEPFMSFEESRYVKIFNKSTKWAFEQEYRTTKFWEKPPTIEERQINLPTEAYKVIILGDKMPIKHIKELTNVVCEHIGNIPLIRRSEYLKLL